MYEVAPWYVLLGENIPEVTAQLGVSNENEAVWPQNEWLMLERVGSRSMNILSPIYLQEQCALYRRLNNSELVEREEMKP
jgi:hypothetical protein